MYTIIGIVAAFVLTGLLLKYCSRFLPSDQGRAYAVDGTLSVGKPRGSGLIFVLVFIACTLAVTAVSRSLTLEMVFYLVLIGEEMLTGFLDDASDKPWSPLIKGLLDLAVSILVAVVFLCNNPPTLVILGHIYTLPVLVYGICIVALVWVSINVTNCADGVDGLSGTLAVITLTTVYFIMQCRGRTEYSAMLWIFVGCMLGYLWFNATPSRVLMGDAGSRAMGALIAILLLKSASPLLYIPAAAVILIDGGIGLVKVALIHCHIRILKHTQTPLHDYVRKQRGWSNTQTVFRFAILQLMISAVLLGVMVA